MNAAPRVVGKGYADRTLAETEVRELPEEALSPEPLHQKRILMILPEGTRSGPVAAAVPAALRALLNPKSRVFNHRWDLPGTLKVAGVLKSAEMAELTAGIVNLETPRIQVALATAIPEEVCRAVNLGYRDPESVRPEAWAGREDEGLLLTEGAGATGSRSVASKAASTSSTRAYKRAPTTS